MKKLALAAVALLASVVAASAQPYPRDGGPRGPGPGWSGPPPGMRPLPPPPVRPLPPRRPIVVYTPPPRFAIWSQSAFPYQARYHDTCQRKAWRLRWFERRAGDDGYFTAAERYELSALRRDLSITCGGWRWRD